MLYGLVILRLERRRLVWTDVTAIQPPSGSPGSYNGVRTHLALDKDTRYVDLRRQSGVSHQSLGSEVFIGSTFG